MPSTSVVVVYGCVLAESGEVGDMPATSSSHTFPWPKLSRLYSWSKPRSSTWRDTALNATAAGHPTAPILLICDSTIPSGGERKRSFKAIYINTIFFTKTGSGQT